MRTNRVIVIAVSLLAVPVTVLAQAQNYPSAPMRIVVPFPPGGGTDMLARMLSQKLNETWGQPVITDNRPGANGTIGAGHVATTKPDGLTMLLVPSGFAVNPSIYPKLPFDTLRDFQPITQLAASPLLVVVHPSLPVKSIKELIALAKSNPGMINYASSGNGSPPHLATEQFKYMTGIQMTHVPYRGGGPALADTLAGHVPIYFNALLPAMPHAKSGRLRALAVTTAKRFPAVPDIPSIEEAGVPGYDMSNWYGLLVAGKTPRDIYMKLNAEVVRILNLPDVKDRLANDGAAVVGSTPDDFMAFLRKEIVKNANIVKLSGMAAN